MKTGIKLVILLFSAYFSLLESPLMTHAKDNREFEKIRFAVLYKGDRGKMEKRYEKLNNFLRQRLFDLELRYFRDPQEIEILVGEMKNGNIDIAGEFSPLDYLESKRYLIPLVRTIWNGRDFYYGIILAKEKEKNIRSLRDLKGKTIAFSNPRSASGFIYPRAEFFKHDIDMKEKARPGSGYVSFVLYGSSKYVLEELLHEGSEIAAGAIPQFLYIKAINENESIRRKLRLLKGGRLGPIKNGVFVCREGFPEDKADRFKELLINLAEEPPPGFFDSWNGFQGWLTWEDGDYDGLIRAMNTPSPIQEAVLRYFIIVGIVVLFGSGLFVFFRLIKKGEK